MGKTHIPQIRFKGFDGEWEKSVIKDIFKVTRGYVLATKDMSAIQDSKYCYPVYSSQTSNKGITGYYDKYLYENAITWTTDGANAGDVNYREGKFYCTNVCGVLLNNSGYSNLCFAKAINRISKNYVSYVGNPKLMNNVMSEIRVFIPTSISEQTRIASLFTALDKQICCSEAKLDKLRTIKKTLLKKMFALQGEKTPQIRFKGFDGEWEEKIFEDICTFGNGYTPSKAIDAYWEKGTLPWFRLEDIRENGRILKDSIQHITPQAVKGKLFPANSIIMSTTATIGEHALLIADSLANQRFTFFIKNANRYNYNDLFFFYKCFSIGDWCKKNSNAGGLLAVNMPELKKLIISFPNSISEQTRIGSLFTSLDKQISLQVQKIEKLKAVKKTLLKKMFV